MKSIIQRSQTEVILSKPYKNYNAYQRILVYKSLLPELVKGNYVIHFDTIIKVLPLCNFLYKDESMRFRFYKHEPITITAYMLSNIITFKYVLDLDIQTLNPQEIIEIFDQRKYEERIAEEIAKSMRSEVKEPQKFRYFIATLKGGHVGKHLYYPMKVVLIAKDEEDAKLQAIQQPRVKHKQITDVIDLQEVDEKACIDQFIENNENDYHTSTNSYEAKNWKKAHRHEFIKDK
jgi:hypothetical protein